MNIITAPNSSFLTKNKRIEILVLEGGQYSSHCDAIVLEESLSDFLILCASPCVEKLGRTFHVQREGFPHPSEVLLKEGSTLLIRGKTFGYHYYGTFV